MILSLEFFVKNLLILLELSIEIPVFPESFDTSYEEAYSSYCKMFVLYMKIFNSLGVRVLPVKADSGPIGGDLSHEFIIESNEGESDIFFDDNIWNESFNNIDINDKNDVINYVEKISTYYCCTAEKHNEEK